MPRAVGEGRAATRAVWGVVAVGAVLWLATAAMTATRAHGIVSGDDPVPDTVFGLVWVVFVGVGAVIVSRQPRNGVGWAFMASGSLQLLYGLSTEYALRTLVLGATGLPFGEAAAWGHFNLSVLSVPIFPFMLLWFPTGAPPSPRWRVVGWVAAASVVALVVSAAWTWPSRGVAMLADPTPPFPGDTLALTALMAASVATPVAALSLIVRFVRSRGVERQQLKLLAMAGSLLVVVMVLDLGGVLHEDTATLVDVLVAVSFGTIPVAAGVAMLRYRLFDVDRLLSRTVSYAVVIATLATVYVGAVLLLGAVSRWLAPGASADLAVAGSTLAAAAAFHPLRRRIVAAVDRRFDRAGYDAAQVVAAFGRRLRDEVDLSVLDTELRATVTRTVQPTGIGLWLPPAPARR